MIYKIKFGKYIFSRGSRKGCSRRTPATSKDIFVSSPYIGKNVWRRRRKFAKSFSQSKYKLSIFHPQTLSQCNYTDKKKYNQIASPLLLLHKGQCRVGILFASLDHVSQSEYNFCIFHQQILSQCNYTDRQKYNQIVSPFLVLHKGSSKAKGQCRVGIWFVSLVHVKSLHHYTVPMKILPEKTVQS